MQNLPGITHEYGPWSPMRFMPVPFRTSDEPPAFWITTSRMCRGIHDFLCTQGQTQVFGPLVLDKATEADLWRCANCDRVQPTPCDLSPHETPVCLFCSDMAITQTTAAGLDSTAAIAAAAALSTASATLRRAKDADPDGYLALLDDTGDTLRALLDDAAWAVHQDHRRARHTGYRGLVMIARQITANGQDLASLRTEPLPVAENDPEENLTEQEN